MLRLISFLIIFLLHLGLPIQAYACACCGIDDTWYRSDFAFEDYDHLEFEKLQFSKGYFTDAPSYENNYEIVDVDFDKKNLKLAGPKFKAVLMLEDKGTHSRQDISFAVRPDSTQVDDAAILHEMVIGGQLTLQIDGSLETKHSAKFIMQGVGNACLSEKSFAKWMIKIENHDLEASGQLNFDDPAIPATEVKE